MIREQSRFTINPIYIVAVSMCVLAQYIDSFYQGVLFGLLTTVISLLCTNLVSLVEKIANKNLRAFLIAMLSAMVIVVVEYCFELIGWQLFLDNMENLKWVVVAVITISIVPTYFETRLTTKHYFAHMFLSIVSFLLMIVLYSAIIEMLGNGSICGMRIFGEFTGFVFANQLFFKLLLIGVLTILANFIYQKIEDKNMRFEILVEKYKMQIKQVLNQRDKIGGANND